MTVTTTAFAQQPADTTQRKQPVDTTKPAQPIEAVHIEAQPAPKPATEAERRVRFGGHLYTRKDFEQVGARGWMDMARWSLGVNVVFKPARRGSTLWVRALEMRATGGGRREPPVFINGIHEPITSLDWNDIIPIELITKMEVYSSTNVPPQFQMAGGCGSILLWTDDIDR